MSGVLVVGAGAAGVAAAWSARRAGREVTVVSNLPGATALSGGAVDDLPWEDLARASRLLGTAPTGRTLASETREFCAALGAWDVPEAERVWLATVAGRVRPARGRDRALLDLGSLTDALVVIPRAPRVGWDADALASGLEQDPFARARRLTFRAVELPVLRFEEERRVSDLDLAVRHDDEARLGWLATRLREALAVVEGAGAVLLGPWLGASEARAVALSRAVGVPVGEALVGQGSAAGLRFEAARDRLLRAIGARQMIDRVTSLVGGSGKIVATLERDDAPLVADLAVLAIGGLAGGGVIYAPPEHGAGVDLPAAGRVPFELSLRAPVRLSLRGKERMGIVGSLYGPELDLSAWPGDGRTGALETVGVLCEQGRAADGIWAAGEVVAGRARTILEAVTSGIAAGAA